MKAPVHIYIIYHIKIALEEKYDYRGIQRPRDRASDRAKTVSQRVNQRAGGEIINRCRRDLVKKSHRGDKITTQRYMQDI